jgi:hypothetical protein
LESVAEMLRFFYICKMEQVKHPKHYGGENNPYEAIKVIEAWDLGFCLGNVIKYISRAGKKDPQRNCKTLKKLNGILIGIFHG